MSILLKNAITYQFTNAATAQGVAVALGSVLPDHPFTPCGELQELSMGAVKLPGNDRYFDNLDPTRFIFALHTETRSVPAATIKLEVAKEIHKLDRPVRRKERLEITEDVKQRLLPRAFSKHETTFGIIDTERGTLTLSCGGYTKGDRLTAFLRKALGSLPIQLPLTNHEPGRVLASGLSEDIELPTFCSFMGGVRMVLDSEEKSTATFNNIPLADPALQEVLQEGYLVDQILLDFNDEVMFKLTRGLELKGIRFADIVEAQMEEEGDEWADFAAGMVIQADILSRVMEKLIEAFGGDAEALAAS